MHPRANPAELSAPIYKKFLEFSMAIHGDGIDHALRDLINIRASQINGCAFCLDMHVKEAKIHGERELRLHHLAIWRESALFTPRERAALTWAEALTRLPVEGITDSFFQDVRAVFSDREISDLTFAVIAINGWNRLSIGFANVPGSLDAAYGLTKARLD